MRKVIFLLLFFSSWLGIGQQLESEPAWYLESIEVDGNLIPVPVNSENLEIEIRFFFDYDIFVFESASCYFMKGNYFESANEVTFDILFEDGNTNCSLNENSDYSQLYNSLFENNITYTFMISSGSEGRMLEINHPNGNKINYRSTPLGIEDVANPEINLIPNPAVDFIEIRGAKSQVSELTVFNQMGQRVKAPFDSRSQRIDLSHLATGLYFIEISSEGKKQIQKLIKN